MKLLHRIYALLWILVLLFALSGKSYHVLIEHHEEEVCGNSDTHYHEKEHSCFICEFELQFGEDVQHVSLNTVELKLSQSVLSFYSSPVLTEDRSIYDLRGPPFV